jgi:hypothetical protein
MPRAARCGTQASGGDGRRIRTKVFRGFNTSAVSSLTAEIDERVNARTASRPPLPAALVESCVNFREEDPMHFIILAIFLGLAAIIVWVADYTSVGGGRRATAIDVLNRRLARGEIDRAEYDEKRKLIGR